VGYLSFPEKPAVWDLLKSEIAALEQCDIPFFTVKVSETALRHAHGECPEYFERPVKEAILERLERMGPTDAEFQVAILRGSFAARVLTGMTDDSSETGMGTLPGLSTEAAIARAERWGQELLDRAIEGEDGSLTWLGIGYVPQANQVQFRPLGDNLYDGRPGVAIFFASLFKITGEEKWADATQATVRTLVQGSTRLAQVATGEDAPATEIGAAVGVGSAIYALTQCGALLGDGSMIEAAERVAGLLDACIESDVYYDVVVGTAGALLSLLALAKVNPEGIAPGLAARCAKHLVNAAEPTGVGVMGWRTMEGHFLTGMSHGVAGVAYALARYAEYSDDKDLMELAMAGIRYENQFFDAEAGNWRDLRASGPGFASSWCYGAPGIGLARLGMWRTAGTEELLQDVRFALTSIESAPMSRSDHPCCGTLGKAELAIEAFEALGDGGSLDLARKQAAHVMAKEDANGRLTFYEGYPDCYNPGFFQGVAGIGYSLLRIACPGQLPSIMLWEAPR
ncbi:type 2 lantipeptide synthetase LanM, partial [bacterium]